MQKNWKGGFVVLKSAQFALRRENDMTSFLFPETTRCNKLTECFADIDECRIPGMQLKTK